jgi:hypothetical protein
MPLGPEMVGKKIGVADIFSASRIMSEADKLLLLDNPNYHYYKYDIPVEKEPNEKTLEYIINAYKMHGWPRVHCFTAEKKAKDPAQKDILCVCIELGS